MVITLYWLSIGYQTRITGTCRIAKSRKQVSEIKEMLRECLDATKEMLVGE